MALACEGAGLLIERLKMTKIDFRKQIQHQMTRQKINVPEMSRRIGCNQQTLYDFLADRKALGADYLQAVLNELKAKIGFE